MNDFLYYCPVRVHFGTNILQKALPMELPHMGKNVMLAYGGGSVKRSGLYDTLVLALEQAGNENDWDYIKAHHKDLIKEYLSL